MGVPVNAALGAIGGDIAGKEGKNMQDAANASNLMQLNMFNQQRDDQAPWRQAGGAALSNLMAGFGHKTTMPENYGLSHTEAETAKNLKMLLETSPHAKDKNSFFAKEWQKQLDGITNKSTSSWKELNPESTMEMGAFNKDFSMADFEKDPGYEFRLAEGQKALERSAAARGGLNSGGTLKSLERYSQGVASDEYNNAFNRFNANRDSRYNKLANLAGMGQTATAQVGQAGQNYANMYGQNVQAGQNARSAGNIQRWNSFQQGMEKDQEQMMQGAGMAATMFCDERLKENVSEISKADILEFRKAIKPKLFTYINSGYGEGEFIGPMAQDLIETKLGKKIVYVNAQGNLVIDQTKTLMLLLAISGEGA